MRKIIMNITNGMDIMEVYKGIENERIDIEITNEEDDEDDSMTTCISLDKQQIQELINKLQGLL